MSIRGKHLHLDCASGAAGDMTLGALLDLGVPVEVVGEALDAIGAGRDRLRIAKVVKHGIAATDLKVSTEGSLGGAAPHPHEKPGRIEALAATPVRLQFHVNQGEGADQPAGKPPSTAEGVVLSFGAFARAAVEGAAAAIARAVEDPHAGVGGAAKPTAGDHEVIYDSGDLPEPPKSGATLSIAEAARAAIQGAAAALMARAREGAESGSGSSGSSGESGEGSGSESGSGSGSESGARSHWRMPAPLQTRPPTSSQTSTPSQTRTPAETPAPTQDHAHAGDHDHDHAGVHVHEHVNVHVGDHDHDHEHDHDHGAPPPSDAHSHVHSHGSVIHTHAHVHGDGPPHSHAHAHGSVTHTHSHEHEHAHAHPAGSHSHAHGDAHADSHGDARAHSHGASDAHAHGKEHGHSHGDAHPHSHGDAHGHSHGDAHPHSHGDAHGHSHGDAHGHSHGDAHAHSHGDAHAHSHGAGSHPHHHYGELRARIVAAALTPGTKQRALDIFDRLARAEAKIHGKTVEDVVFHEVGAIDSVVDIVGTAAALDWLDPRTVTCTGVAMGHGTIVCAHGVLPVPAPAALEVLVEAKGVMTDGGLPRELCTPTGAAILAATVTSWTPAPAGTPLAIGWGAGDADLRDRANVLRAVVIEPSAIAGTNDSVWQIDANLDDMSPELCAPAVEAVFAAGALDVWWTPITMKKGRPALTLSALVETAKREAVIDAILRETTTIGVRYSARERTILARSMVEVETRYGRIRIKVSSLGGSAVNAAPEYEECVAAARRFAVPVKQVYAAALAAYDAGVSGR